MVQSIINDLGYCNLADLKKIEAQLKAMIANKEKQKKLIAILQSYKARS